jgi:molecular chaperone GrpE
MNSNIFNKEQGQSAGEAPATDQTHEKPNDAQPEDEVRVSDKRRFNPDGEPVAAETGENPQDGAADNQTSNFSDLQSLQAKLKESEEKRAEAERQVRDFAERFRSAQTQLRAEADEQRSRLQRNFDQKLEAARGDLVAGLLDTLDNLKRAIEAAENGEKREADFDSLLEGVRATANMFETRMQSLGLSVVPSAGEEFNPEIHEAVEMVPVDKDLDHKVIEELQTGYKLGDRLLRPARVRVGRATD